MTRDVITADRILENVRLAAGASASPAMLLAVALASSRAADLGQAFDTINRLRPEIERIARETPTPHRTLADLEPDLKFEPELAAMRLERRDHELRGRLLFADLLGEKGFVEIAALAIAGCEISRADAELLSKIGVVTQLADPRIWPLTVTRRIAAAGGSLADSVVAGVASLCTQQMTALPVAGFMRFLERTWIAVGDGDDVRAFIERVIRTPERIPGVGRPVLDGDERVEPMLALMEEHRRSNGRYVTLAREIDQVLSEAKGLRVNSAGLHGALLLDLGFSPDAGAAFSLLYFMVPLLAHASFAAERTNRTWTR